MAINYHVHKRGFVEFRMVGTNTVQDYLDVIGKIRLDDETSGIRCYLFDTSQIETPMSADQLAALASQVVGQLPEDQRFAVLITSELSYGVTRQFQSLAELPNMQTFVNRELAIEWLLESAD